MYTKREIKAIRFYQGDNKELIEKGNGDFWALPSAYQTINCLMFDGISNEKERIKEATKKLQPQVIEEVEKTIEVFCSLYSSMYKNVHKVGEKKELNTFRTERGISIEELKKGHTVSFTSTSKSVNMESFFYKKSDLTLLVFKFSTEIPHLDYETVLGQNNKYPQQREILLPPFLKISLEDIQLTDKEKEYKDINGNSPCGKYEVRIEGLLEMNPEAESEDRQELTKEKNERAAELLKKLINSLELSEEEEEEYTAWKKDFRASIWKKFKEIENSNGLKQYCE